MIQLDERLDAIASLVLEEIRGKEKPVAADIGCDHGFLTAALLERCGQLFMIASDISGPSLEKAQRLLARKGLEHRAKTIVSDGLDGIDRRADVVVIAGMGAQTILKIVREGKERLCGASLIVQANVDLPLLRSGLFELGYTVEREEYVQAAGRHYVTMLMRPNSASAFDERSALLGTASNGIVDHGQRAYYLWQRDVRAKEVRQMALHDASATQQRFCKSSRELDYIAEAISMNKCTVADIESLVGGIAPFELAEEWDNVGLLLGRRGAAVTRVLVALDLTQAVINEAKALGAQAIVTHHPIMFSARKRVTDDDREGALMLRLAESGIAHIAAHTNLDAAHGGVNDVLMSRMGAKNVTGEGCIRVGDLDEDMTLDGLAARAQRSLKTQVRVYGAGDMPVRKLGCCSGAGSSAIAEAAALGADCFITGEVKHNLALEAMDMGCGVIEAGHYETENPVCEVLTKALQSAADELKYNVTVFCSGIDPFGR